MNKLFELGRTMIGFIQASIDWKYLSYYCTAINLSGHRPSISMPNYHRAVNKVSHWEFMN